VIENLCHAYVPMKTPTVLLQHASSFNRQNQNSY
jgi:hypothetical protein